MGIIMKVFFLFVLKCNQKCSFFVDLTFQRAMLIHQTEISKNQKMT